MKQGLLYSTDSQFDQNSIRLLKQDSNENWVSEFLFNLNGSSIYGMRLGDKFVFSTAVEGLNNGNLVSQYLRRKKAPAILKNESQIVVGDLYNGFELIYSNEKDIYPFLLFQFGNLIFPTGINHMKKIVFTNVALKKDDLCTIILDYEV